MTAPALTVGTVVLILAAGQSSRMRGGDKLCELVDGVPLLRLQCERALGLGLPVYVALPSADHPRLALIADLPVTPLFVPEASEGMSGSMRGAVGQMPVWSHLLMVLPDLVEIETADMAAVLAGLDQAPEALIWRGATEDLQPGHPILFDGSLRENFATISGDQGGNCIVRPYRDRMHLVPLPDQRARRDLDTPEEWAAFRAETGR